MKLVEVLNDIIGVPVYHHTFENRAVSIIQSNSMMGTKPDDDLLDFDPTLKTSKHQRMVSFTRDKNFIPDQSIGASVGSGDSSKLNTIFVLDLNKLKTRYRVVPYDYSSLDMKYYEKRRKEEPDTEINPPKPREGKNNEREERVLTNIIYPLRPYIINIIYKGDNPEIISLINQYLGK